LGAYRIPPGTGLLISSVGVEKLVPAKFVKIKLH
jgi:hypothetical protein